MNQQEIETKVVQLICKAAEISKDEVKLETELEDEFDSLGQVELLLELEEGFGIDISDEDAETFKTVKDVVDYVTKRLS